MEHLLWTEKYRPKKIVDCILPERLQKPFQEYVNRLNIKLPDQNARATDLSGGNQQKVVLAKWLERNCEILFFDDFA